MSRPSPQMEALAYRVWALLTPRGWDMTVAEAAEELGVSRQRLMWCLKLKGWSHRMRVTHRHDGNRGMPRFPLNSLGGRHDNVERQIAPYRDKIGGRFE